MNNRVTGNNAEEGDDLAIPSMLRSRSERMSMARFARSITLSVMTATKGIKFGNRFFWAYDVAAGVFLKHLIDEAETSKEADAAWLLKAISDWRLQAVITEYGLSLEETWSNSQRQTFIELAERACKKIATRESIPAAEMLAGHWWTTCISFLEAKLRF